jgi:hypothetical protein
VNIVLRVLARIVKVLSVWMTLKLAATVIATDAQTADLPTARRWADPTRAKVKMNPTTTRTRRVLFWLKSRRKRERKKENY